MNKNPHISEETWEDIKHRFYTPAEIAENDLRCAMICEFIKARNEMGLSQKDLEEMSGVKQPVISRMERGTSIPNVSTILKLLAPLGKTLAVVPINHVQE